MGYMCAHAIIVYSWDAKLIATAHDEARRIFRGTHEGTIGQPVSLVTELTPPTVNGHRSFMVAPDGSKEGWPESDRCDNARTEFKAWLRTKAYGDGSTSLRWVEVMFSDDEGHAAVIDHDANRTTENARGMATNRDCT